jgi:hypothetical protein
MILIYYLLLYVALPLFRVVDRNSRTSVLCPPGPAFRVVIAPVLEKNPQKSLSTPDICSIRVVMWSAPGFRVARRGLPAAEP